MKKTTILIVEDEAIVAADLAGKLGRLGYDVVGCAVRGEEGVELAGRLLPALVIMDIRLKGSMDGIEAAEAIGRKVDIPIIYLTAHSDAATLARAKVTGPFGYVLKPFEERELATAIEMALYRHRSDREVRDQREWLKVTLSSIGDAVVTCDTEGRVTFLNPVAEELTGWTTEEAEERSIQEVFRLINEQTHEPMEDPVALVMREGRPTTLANHTALVTKDGREIPIEDSASPILDARGRVIGAVLVFHDVTEKRRAQEALRESEARFRLALRNAPVSVAAQDRDLKYIWAYNQRTARPEEIIGRRDEEIFTPEEAAHVTAIKRRVLEEDIELREQMWFNRPSGRMFLDVCWEPIHDGTGRVTGVASATVDLTPVKRAEEALRENKARLDLALQSAEMGAWHWDIKEDKRYFDDQVCRLLGINPASFGGSAKEFFDTVLPGDREKLQKALSRTIEEDTLYNPEYRAVWPDGSIHHIAARGRLFRDSAGRPARINGIIWDITERKAGEEALRLSEEKFARAFATNPAALVITRLDDGTYLEMNETWEAMLGYRRDEVVGTSSLSLNIWPNPGERERIARELREKGSLRNREQTLLRRSGKPFVALLSAEVMTMGGEDVILSTWLDITENKLKEMRIARLSQLYAMISRVNEAIVRTQSEGELYEDVCRIIAGEGAFPLVFIGEVKDRQLVPVASCGPAADYLKEIRIEVDGKLGQGPGGTAIREDRPVVNDDFDTNDRTLPWREPARRHGFRASACFPFHRGGKVIGALTLYSPRPNDFDPEQVDLLQALAADVSFALDTMEEEKLRSQAEADLRRSIERFELLAYTASELLQSPDPQRLVNSLCREVMEHLGCHAFFNFLAVEEAGRLRLNAYAGIPEEEAQKIAWLDYGVAVCGCAAQDACRIVAEHIPTTPDPRTELVKSYGIKAYACHPLLESEGKVIGTLSFGTCDRETFSDQDLSLMKAVADQVAVAMIRMRDEEAVRRSRDELEQRVQERTASLRRQADLLELAYEAIIVRDMEDRIIFWNARAEELYGWTKSEALGSVTNSLLRTKFPVSVYDCTARLKKENHWEGELIHSTKDGRQITILSRQALQRDEEGNPLAILEINLDVTGARQTEAQLRQAQKMEALGVLSGGIAHDFNNILAAIVGFGELLRDHAPKESHTLRHAQRVVDAALRGRELVRQLLIYSRQTEQEKKPMLLSSIVKETVKLVRSTTPTTISIRTTVTSESGLVLADPTQIHQVVMNLCTNAAHAMRERGGVLDIALSDSSVGPSDGNPGGIKPGLYMKLTVSDTGIGISPDIMDRIFDPFFTTKGLGEGTGLGLSVVHGIVKQSGGYITIESESGKGSTFDVYFPKIEEQPQPEAPLGDEIPVGFERILFVDDEEALVEMGEEVLAELGYAVTSKMSSEEALSLLKEDPTRFDLVITDQTMPEMTGIELARQILSVRPDMPIIMATGFSHLVDADKAKAAGIRAFVMKPLTKGEIARTIRKVLTG